MNKKSNGKSHFEQIPAAFGSQMTISSRQVAFAAVMIVLLAVTACNKGATPASNAAIQTNSTLSPQDVKSPRLAWNLTTLVDSYDHAGYSNPVWDAPAKAALTEFARRRANVCETNEPSASIISTNAAGAVELGCNDPMVNYLFINFALDKTNSKETFTAAFCKMAKEMQNSSYPNIRKFAAAFRTGEQFIRANNYPTNVPPEIKEIGHDMDEDLKASLDDNSIPSEEIYDACDEFLEMWKTSPKKYQMYYHAIEPQLFKNWPDASTSWLLKGEGNIDIAWQGRGGGYADTVTEEGWKQFKDHLAIADEALGHAWQLNPKDPRIAVMMIWVELGQGQGRDRMEMWFQRAMELDPNDYDACSVKCLYLEPKWHGSIEEMLTFGRSCVANKQWGGRVPLVLVDAHWDIPRYYLTGSEKTNYWKQPQVWPDIESAYERFFEANTDVASYYHNYALYAYKCEQWDKLNELISKLGPVNYDFFGGKTEFDKMVRLAKEHAGKPSG
jgi:hypothetical protein